MARQTKTNDLMKLFEKTNTENPKPEDIKELKKLLSNDPQFYYKKYDMMRFSMDDVIKQIKGNALVNEYFEMNIKAIQLDLGYIDAQPIEKLLIAQITLNWIRMVDAEFGYTESVHGPASIKIREYWERRLSMTQNRYLKAIEALVRVRKVCQSTVQVNIATEGGKQVNVNR